ncbi:uncharacterized protein LOC144099048 [Amblyomma americanum]
MSAKEHEVLSCRLREEIIQFLNDHELIRSKNRTTNRWAYCALGQSLAVRYPCMAWVCAKPGTKMQKGKNKKNCWSVFIRRLSVCRKVQKWRMRQKLQDANTALTTPAASTTPTIPPTPSSETASIKQE